jgi:hypothetical protein
MQVFVANVCIFRCLQFLVVFLINVARRFELSSSQLHNLQIRLRGIIDKKYD